MPQHSTNPRIRPYRKLHLYLYEDTIAKLEEIYGKGNLSHTVRRVLDKHLEIQRPEHEYVDRLETRMNLVVAEVKRQPRKRKAKYNV